MKESTPTGELLLDDEYGEHRRDVLLTIHSHPGGEPSLRPSVPDLEGWESLRISNPNVIEGVVVKSGRQAKLLFYQRDPNLEQNTYYQQWDTDESVGILLRLMRESGIRYQILTFDLKSKSFTPKDLEKVNNFTL